MLVHAVDVQVSARCLIYVVIWKNAVDVLVFQVLGACKTSTAFLVFQLLSMLVCACIFSLMCIVACCQCQVSAQLLVLGQCIVACCQCQCQVSASAIGTFFVACYCHYVACLLQLLAAQLLMLQLLALVAFLVKKLLLPLC